MLGVATIEFFYHHNITMLTPFAQAAYDELMGQDAKSRMKNTRIVVNPRDPRMVIKCTICYGNFNIYNISAHVSICKPKVYTPPVIDDYTYIGGNRVNKKTGSVEKWKITGYVHIGWIFPKYYEPLSGPATIDEFSSWENSRIYKYSPYTEYEKFVTEFKCRHAEKFPEEISGITEKYEDCEFWISGGYQIYYISNPRSLSYNQTYMIHNGLMQLVNIKDYPRPEKPVANWIGTLLGYTFYIDLSTNTLTMTDGKKYYVYTDEKIWQTDDLDKTPIYFMSPTAIMTRFKDELVYIDTTKPLPYTVYEIFYEEGAFRATFGKFKYTFDGKKWSGRCTLPTPKHIYKTYGVTTFNECRYLRIDGKNTYDIIVMSYNGFRIAMSADKELACAYYPGGDMVGHLKPGVWEYEDEKFGHITEDLPAPKDIVPNEVEETITATADGMLYVSGTRQWLVVGDNTYVKHGDMWLKGIIPYYSTWEEKNTDVRFNFMGFDVTLSTTANNHTASYEGITYKYSDLLGSWVSHTGHVADLLTLDDIIENMQLDKQICRGVYDDDPFATFV